jgi:hypothetical protein
VKNGNGRGIFEEFCLQDPTSTIINSRVILHAANLRHGTDGITSTPKEGMLRIFRPKNPTAAAGFDTRSWVPEGSMLTTRPPMSLSLGCEVRALTLTKIFVL